MKSAGIAQQQSVGRPRRRSQVSNPAPRSTFVRKPARGSIDPKRPHVTQIVVGFDTETFDQIKSMAAKANISFAEAVRQLCEWGLELLEKEAA